MVNYKEVFAKRILLCFLLLALNFFAGSKQLYSMEADEGSQALTQQELAGEVQDLVDTTPTGFTFLFRRFKSDLGVIASFSWQTVAHPINSVEAICSNVSNTVSSIIGYSAATGYQAVRHPIETVGMALTITLHPIMSVSRFISYCDHIAVYDFPIISGVDQRIKQFSGFVRVTPEQCPHLHSLLAETTHTLGCESLERVYIYKGNGFSNILEKLAIGDHSLKASERGLTRGTSRIYLGKDLFLGVNRNQASCVPGMSPEQIQAIFAQNIGHREFRHPLKLAMMDAALAGFLGYLIISSLNIHDYKIEQIAPETYRYIELKVFISKTCCEIFNHFFSRHCVYGTDTYALGALDDPKSMSEALTQLDRIISLKRRPLLDFFSSTPEIGARLNYLAAQAEQQEHAE